MGIADSMKDLSEHIVASHNTRVSMLGNLFADTHTTLKEFSNTRKRMGEEQAKDLNTFVNGLLNNFHKVRVRMKGEQTKRLHNFVKDLEKKTADLLTHCCNDHRQMSDEQAKGLAGFVKDLTKNVQNMLKDFSRTRQQMSDKQAKKSC